SNFTKQNRLRFEFTEATFSFTDDTFDQLAAKVHWAPSGAAADDLYVKRQQQREDLGAEIVPHLFKSLLSTNRKRTAVFFADLKTKNAGWVEVHYNALDPEEIGVGRWGRRRTVQELRSLDELPGRRPQLVRRLGLPGRQGRHPDSRLALMPA